MTDTTTFGDCRPAEILLVDDSRTDVMLTEEGLRDAKIHNQLHVVGDGLEAMAFARKEGQYADAPRPDLILFRLYMENDFETIRAMVEAMWEVDEVWRTSLVPLVPPFYRWDRMQVGHAPCSPGVHITWPVDFEQFAEVVQSIDGLWFTVVTLPSERLEP